MDGLNLLWGAFGENLTSEGLLEETIQIGDRFRIGTAEVIVTEPRLPCYKLAVKFNREDIIKLFLRSRRTGFYFAVEQEGKVGAEDSIEFLGRDENAITVAELVQVYLHRKKDQEAIGASSSDKSFATELARLFREQIEKTR